MCAGGGVTEEVWPVITCEAECDLIGQRGRNYILLRDMRPLHTLINIALKKINTEENDRLNQESELWYEHMRNRLNMFW